MQTVWPLCKSKSEQSVAHPFDHMTVKNAKYLSSIIRDPTPRYSCIGPLASLSQDCCGIPCCRVALARMRAAHRLFQTGILVNQDGVCNLRKSSTGKARDFALIKYGEDPHIPTLVACQIRRSCLLCRCVPQGIRARVKYRSWKGWSLAVGDLKAAARALPLERRPR